jgi:hypothetical protein
MKVLTLFFVIFSLQASLFAKKLDGVDKTTKFEKAEKVENAKEKEERPLIPVK